MSSNLDFSHAREEDLPELLELLPHLSRRPHSAGAQVPPFQEAKAILARIRQYENMALLLARERLSNHLVGALTWVIVPNFTYRGRPWAMIENVVVHRDYRQQGIGTAIMQHAFTVLQEYGCYKVQLLSGIHDYQQRFYTGLGMDDTTCHGYKHYFSSGAEQATA